MCIICCGVVWHDHENHVYHMMWCGVAQSRKPSRPLCEEMISLDESVDVLFYGLLVLFPPQHG